MRHALQLAGTTNGSVQVATAEDITVASTAAIAGDLLVPGTPSLRVNAAVQFGGTVDGGGAALPTGYGVTLNAHASLGHLVQHTDPIAMAPVAAPPLPLGIRAVVVSKANPNAGDFATVRDLTVASNAPVLALPPGTYGNLDLQAATTVVLGSADPSVPTVYNVQRLTIGSNARLAISGRVVVTVGGLTALDAGARAGDPLHPEWLRLRVTGGDVTVGSNATLDALVAAPAQKVTLASNAALVGGLACDGLVQASNAVLTLLPLAPPQVALTAPGAGSVFLAPALDIGISATVTPGSAPIAQVDFFAGSTPLGTASAAPYDVHWTNVAPGTYSLTAVATDVNGLTATSPAVAVTVNAAPAITLTAPADGSVVNAPGAVTLQATAADSDGTVAKVDFYQNATLLGTVTGAPYQWPLTGLAAGDYTFSAVATDNLGATALSDQAFVTVNAPPTVSLTAPADGASAVTPASFTVAATAADSDGVVAKVDFFNGSDFVGTASAAPYQVNLSGLGVGTYTLTAVATDDDGAATTSAPITILVHANHPPTVVLTAPVSGASFTAPASIALSATAADDDGTIAMVDFYQGTALLGTVSTAPYHFNWGHVPAGTYMLTAVATDNLGATTLSSPATITVADPAPATITFDSASSGTTTVSGSSMGWSHALTADPGTNRVLVVGVVSRGSSVANASVSSVTFAGVPMLPLTNSIANAGSSTFNRSQLFYLLDAALPAAGTYPVQVTFATSQSTSNSPIGGAVVLANVSQAAPAAFANSGGTANTSTITTTVPAGSGSWVVDTVGVGSTSANLITNAPGMVTRFALQGASAAAGATKVADATGSVTMAWKSSSARQVQSLAVFAPALAVATAPSISVQPAAQTAGVGSTVTLTVTASGSAPLSYQWSRGSSTIPGATTSTLTLTNVQTSDTDTYTVLVSNSVGTVTSDGALVSVHLDPPAITTQPLSLSVNAGDPASFTVVATGTAPLAYQWLKEGATIPGATGVTYTIASAQGSDAASYSVQVSNALTTVFSDSAVLAVNTGPVGPMIVTQPVSQTVGVGTPASFSVTATGTAPLQYQWTKNGTALGGATSATLSFAAAAFTDIGNYQVIVSNGVATVPSTIVTLAVNALTAPSALYNLAGFATVGPGTTGGGTIAEDDPAYRHVYTPLDLANALAAANKTAGAVKVIEIMNDLDLGWNEIGTAVQTLASTPFRSHAAPKLHPVLLVTGMSLLDIKPKSGLTIFSASGATIRHCNFNIKSTSNIIVRNLKFDENWEWDEATKGNYDSNDWDFITLSNGGAATNIWIDHCTFTKSYDGLVDMKAGTQNVTLSWCRYVGDDGATNPHSWVRQQLDALEANKSAYPFYNFLRTRGYSEDDIATIIQGHDKGHLMGSNSLDSGNATLSATFHHQWFRNLWDRCVPRLRAGNVHNYDIYVDDTQVLAARRLREARAALLSTSDQNTLNNTYSFRPPINGSISTEGGALLLEKSVYVDCLTPLRNNQTDPSNAVYTGKILGLDTIYHFDNTDGTSVDVRGNSTDAGNPLGPFQAAIIPFSWNLPGNQLPYTYVTDDPAGLLTLLQAGAGAGTITWSKDNWLKTSY